MYKAQIFDVKSIRKESKMTTLSDGQQAALVLAVDAIYEAIKLAGEAGIPSGHLYAMVTGKMSLDIYQTIISVLEEKGKINNKGHLLTAN